ncbi:superoxide dismutase family protein [Alteribacter keqinensis]|uniref:Superoxide dismutase [Cu-Zn] n=1 Tax=Alteribacter keqinensis TaxID=2483800 RepID=A0A3M7TUG1_9BACI|nr:superoxide dismutase family protein [Alteribacter keqinensis]RNA69288.1 superoxide dismutase family protein [Alteribacter keqinensis]
MKKYLFAVLLTSIVASGCAGENQSSETNEEGGYINNQSVMDHGIQSDHTEAVETFAGGAHDIGELQAKAELKNAADEPVGSVSFFALDEQVIVKAEVKNLETGFHGFHIHDNGVCEADAEEGPFMSAGGHYNPAVNPHDHHAGDMPPVYVTENKTGYLVAKLDRFTPAQLLEDDVAVIVHEDADNFANIPDRYQSSEQNEPGPDVQTLKTGDAGDRAACGVVTKP